MIRVYIHGLFTSASSKKLGNVQHPKERIINNGNNCSIIIYVYTVQDMLAKTINRDHIVHNIDLLVL